MSTRTNRYDVAIIGAGPVGCATALAFAAKGASVLILEQNPRASERLAGEWLHPPAVAALATLGLELEPGDAYATGRGFAVFPDDGSRPVVLPYRVGSYGFALEHKELVELMRQRVAASPRVDYVVHARATKIEGQRLGYQRRHGAEQEVTAKLVVGAAGRASLVHTALGLEAKSTTYSRMAGLLLEDVDMPFEGYGHVFLGGPGPVLAYRIDARRVRMCLDVPLSMRFGRSREAGLWDAYAPVLPPETHAAFRRALAAGAVTWAANQIRPRVDFGREGLVLVGDAVGHFHPLTALGMTLGFGDALALAGAPSLRAFRRARVRATRVPEMLAVALYEVFADTSDEVVAMRRAVYDLWRREPGERLRTMGYLAGEDRSPLRFGSSFLKALVLAGGSLLRDGVGAGQYRHVLSVTGELGSRIRWLLGGTLHLTPAEPTRDLPRTAEERYGAALRASSARAEVVEHPSSLGRAARRGDGRPEPEIALARGVRALEDAQAEDGSWEGEVAWNPMLAAEYVISCRATGTAIDPVRRSRLLLHFARTRLPDGTWGMHELGEPYLFMTTLVYVAARMLGAAPDDPLLAPGLSFIHREGIENIPSWGKFWLAIANLWGWEGCHPVAPEAWRLPRWLPIHPSRYYCHTRHIYLGMAVVYGERFQMPEDDLVRALRRELYPLGFERVDFRAARGALRSAEIHTPPSAPLRLLYRALGALERFRGPASRAPLLGELREHIRWELRASSHTALSPVSGLFAILSLWIHDPDDPDVAEALARLDGWIWEDDSDGARVAGARSATWDTSLAVQSLAAVAPHVDVAASVARAVGFLETQQIRQHADGAAEHFRLDPYGGYCFAGVWHGWPVSDCTAEAMLARLELPATTPELEQARAADLHAAARFVLQCQNTDGSFGSYERKRFDGSLEWLNPAEMFGDSMLEGSYGECTASCVSALAAYRRHYPDVLRPEVDRAVARAVRRLRLQQRPDGSWPAAWGVFFIYGTLFGVRGLLGAGALPQDPAIRKACAWLKARQRPDGGWGEHHDSCVAGRFAELEHSQVIQTAWALCALLEAQDPDFEVLERGARFLAARQEPDGRWPQEEPAGVFFHTALLHYELYRAYFPLWALGLFESRRARRNELCELGAGATPAVG
ncbi:MAG: FAD-dependent oxidoreductase [Myxococcales bacterium]|nr:FAD-dependent oxidoreductase [Myxococcales bacterium]